MDTRTRLPPFAPFEQALRRLFRPAGEDARFATFESMKANRDDFIVQCHNTYKELHYLSITHQFAIQKILQSSALSKASQRDLTYLKLLWQRISDTLVWQMLGHERHRIKRLSLGRPRSPLAECNPDSIIPLLRKLNADPFRMAIWTDATGIIDVGDILYRDFKTGELTICEVKEGEVNSDILQTLHGMPCPVPLEEFVRRRGKKGAEQMLRVIKQMELNSQVKNFLQNEKGFDPSIGKEVETMDLGDIPQQSWDSELSAVLAECETKERVVRSVDDALWLYAERRVSSTSADSEQRFLTMMEQSAQPTARKWMKEYEANDSFPSIIGLQRWIQYHLGFPLFCRDLRVEDMLSIVKGTKVVLMFLDWTSFGKVFAEVGISLEWSSRKEGRREKAKPRRERLLIVGDRLPVLRVGDAIIKVGDSHLLRLFFEGTRPRTLAANFKRMFEVLPNYVKKPAA